MPSVSPAPAPSRDALRGHQLRRLNVVLAQVLPDNPFYRVKLGDVRRLETLDELRELPFTTKSEVAADQEQNPPFGTNLTYSVDQYSRLHQTSGTSGKGPMRWLDTPESWEWWSTCWEHVYRGASVDSTDRIFFAFSFGPFIGFWSAFAGAERLGALAIPGGGMSSEQRVQQIQETRPTVLLCTPTYALRMAEVAREMGVDLSQSSIRAVINAGEPGASIPATRARIEAAYGARCFDHTGMTELGATGFTCREQRGVHLIESEYVAEVIDPASLAPVPPGSMGELVMTNLGRIGSPLIRYRTGDLVELDVEPCPCGSPFARMRGGILGRADDMLVVRGINVYPSAIEGIVREHPEVAEYRIEVRRVHEMDELRIVLEPAEQLSGSASDTLVRQLVDDFHRRLALRVAVSAVGPGELPRFELKARRLVRLKD